MLRRTLIASSLTLLAVTASAQERRSERAFTWDGNLTAGRTLYVRNLNGPIRVDRASGSRASVVATKRWRRGDPAEVRIESRQIGDDVIVCALWHENARCDEDGYRSNGDRRWRSRDDNETSVEFVVELPAGVRLVTSTVNGGLEIRGATAEVEARTVNGSIDVVSSGGPVSARTVNGSIDARMGATGTSDLEFSTVNGAVDITLPESVNADFEARTVNGSIESDFPVTISGRINPRRIQGRLGRGGQRLEISTVNGSVKLRKG